MNTLIQKYNIPGPRYTSYPTVPYWENETFSKEKWIETFKKSFIESNSSEGISLYIHLPFCESLCTFCACHKHITKRHEVENPYIETVLKEWDLYVDLVDETPIIKEKSRPGPGRGKGAGERVIQTGSDISRIPPG